MPIQVTITGVTPLLMHRFGPNATAELEEVTKTSKPKEHTPERDAEDAAYRDADGTLYVPAEMIVGTIKGAASAHKEKSSRRSMKNVAAGAITVTPMRLTLSDKPGGKSLREYKIDSRAVVIPATKGRVLRHRPILEAWSATFVIDIDDEIIGAADVKRFLDEAGRRVGIGDFRPAKGGGFGKFIVTAWGDKI